MQQKMKIFCNKKSNTASDKFNNHKKRMFILFNFSSFSIIIKYLKILDRAERQIYFYFNKGKIILV